MKINSNFVKPVSAAQNVATKHYKVRIKLEDPSATLSSQFPLRTMSQQKLQSASVLTMHAIQRSPLTHKTSYIMLHLFVTEALLPDCGRVVITSWISCLYCGKRSLKLSALTIFSIASARAFARCKLSIRL